VFIYQGKTNREVVLGAWHYSMITEGLPGGPYSQHEHVEIVNTYGVRGLVIPYRKCVVVSPGKTCLFLEIQWTSRCVSQVNPWPFRVLQTYHNEVCEEIYLYRHIRQGESGLMRRMVT
jgi:hypothetical protein